MAIQQREPSRFACGTGKTIKKGDNIILAAFGGGFTWGASWVKWAYDSE